MGMDKTASVMSKIRWCEDQLKLAYRYLEVGEGGDFHIFRPLFSQKLDAGGSVAPPHKDWIRSFFIPRRERALARLVKRLRRLEATDHERRSNRREERRRDFLLSITLSG